MALLLKVKRLGLTFDCYKVKIRTRKEGIQTWVRWKPEWPEASTFEQTRFVPPQWPTTPLDEILNFDLSLLLRPESWKKRSIMKFRKASWNTSERKEAKTMKAYYSYTCDRLLRRIGGCLSLVRLDNKDVVAVSRFSDNDSDMVEFKKVFTDTRLVGEGSNLLNNLVHVGDNGILGKTLQDYTELPFFVRG